jgi:hypothetical protein
MGKRFTDSDKWKDKWFRGLSAVEKLAYMYCLDNCDHAGVIEIDEELADFQIGSSVEWSKFFDKCDGRLMKLDCGKWWVVKFIAYQYGSISEGCKAHNPVFASIQKYELRKAMERVSKGYPKGIQRVQDMDKDKDKDTDKDTDKVKDKAQGGAGGRFSTALACPPDVDPDAWRDWNAVRKAKKLGAATQSVYDSVRREAEKAGLTVGQAIEIAAGESWGGFKATWLDKAKSRDASQPLTFAQISLENSRRAMQEFING